MFNLAGINRLPLEELQELLEPVCRHELGVTLAPILRHADEDHNGLAEGLLR